MFRRRTARLRLDRPEPVSSVFGLDRGKPVDRHYIDAFLAENASRMRGRALEIGDDATLRSLGSAERIDVLHAQPGNAAATIVGDLQQPGTLEPGSFDCIVLVQTLHVIADPAAAIRTCHDALAPGGCILATLPGISQVSRYDMDRWGDFWRCTDRGARKLFAACFADDELEIRAHGNAATACAFLQGIAVEELAPEILAVDHPDYPLVVTVAATRR